MVNHVEAKHVQHEGVVCPLCHKHFATRQAHRMHHSRVHSHTGFWILTPNKTVSQFCINWHYSCSDELKEAIKQRMVKQYDGTWGCSECDFVTKYQATLTNHIEAKHLQSDGYSCQYCNKFCPTKNALKCHVYQRHSQKNSKPFWNGPMLHFERYKWINCESYLDELISAIKSKMRRGSDGMWYCSECDYQTKYSTTLTRHVEAKHLQTSGFECSICQQFCPTRNSLMSHQYRKHDVRYAQSWSIKYEEILAIQIR